MPREPLSTAARVWWLVGLTFLFLFAIYLVANRDIAPIDDSDLALPAPAFDPDRNPFPDFRNFTLTDEEEDRIRNATGKPFRDGGETVEEIDPAVIDQLLIDLADEFALPVISPRAAAERAGIVVLEPEPDRLTVLAASLHNHGVAATTRASRLRLSAHASTGIETLELLRAAFQAYRSAAS